jgi:hypothetical protein
LSKTILLPCVNMGGALLKKSMQVLHPSFDAYNRGEKSRTKNKQRQTCQNDSAALREHGGCLLCERYLCLGIGYVLYSSPTGYNWYRFDYRDMVIKGSKGDPIYAL